jgi:predicted transcriptional regulator
MARLSVSIPDSLERRLQDLAEKENLSVDQLVSTAVAEKISVLLGEEYLDQLAQRGSVEAFERVLAQVPDVEPDPHDRWEK